MTGPLGKGRKGQKDVYPVFENVRLLSSIVSQFFHVIVSHTKQQRIPMSCFLESFVITLAIGIEAVGVNKRRMEG